MNAERSVVPDRSSQSPAVVQVFDFAGSFEFDIEAGAEALALWAEQGSPPLDEIRDVLAEVQIPGKFGFVKIELWNGWQDPKAQAAEVAIRESEK